jgi:hypothetical protein
MELGPGPRCSNSTVDGKILARLSKMFKSSGSLWGQTLKGMNQEVRLRRKILIIKHSISLLNFLLIYYVIARQCLKSIICIISFVSYKNPESLLSIVSTLLIRKLWHWRGRWLVWELMVGKGLNSAQPQVLALRLDQHLLWSLALSWGLHVEVPNLHQQEHFFGVSRWFGHS